MKDPYIFIDLSYFVFHRFFALQRWIKLARIDFKSYDEEKQLVISKFEHIFENTLLSFKKKLKFSWDRLFIVKDCTRDSIWRMAHYPEYKKHRDEKKHEFDPYIFTFTYATLLPQLLSKYGFNLIGYDNAEADDVIAVLHKKIRSNNNSQSIVIITNDNDYLQLLDDNTLIMNSNKTILRDKIHPEILSVFKEWKIIKGDISDNIPSISPKLGDKRALRLAQNKDQLLKKLQEDKSIEYQYNLNKLLIDFDNIPDDIRNGIQTLINGFV